MGIVQLSDQSGQYEAILFQEGLNQYRDVLEKGASLLLGLQASVEGEDVRARIVTAEPLDVAASRVQKGLRISLRDDNPLGRIAQSLNPRGDGEVACDSANGQRRSRDEAARQIAPCSGASRGRAKGDSGH